MAKADVDAGVGWVVLMAEMFTSPGMLISSFNGKRGCKCMLVRCVDGNAPQGTAPFSERRRETQRRDMLPNVLQVDPACVGSKGVVAPRPARTVAMIASHIEIPLRWQLLKAAVSSLVHQTGGYAFDAIIISLSVKQGVPQDDDVLDYLKTQPTITLLTQPVQLRQFQHLRLAALHLRKLQTPEADLCAVTLLDDDDLVSPEFLKAKVEGGYMRALFEAPDERVMILCKRVTSCDRVLQRKAELTMEELVRASKAEGTLSYRDMMPFDFSGSTVLLSTLLDFVENRHGLSEPVDLTGRYVDGFFRLAMTQTLTCPGDPLVWQRQWRVCGELAAWKDD